MYLAARLRPALIACAVLAPLSARADVSGEGASKLEQNIHDWIARLLGPKVNVPPLPLHITAEGDHYRMATDIGGPVADTGYNIDPGSIVALLRPLDDNRWSIDGIRLPSPVRVANPSASGMSPRSWTVKIGDQDMHGLLDTTLATTSTLDAALRDYTATTETADSKQTSHIDSYKAHAVFEPAPDGRLNISAETAAKKMSIAQTLPDAGKVDVAIEKVNGIVRLDRVDPARLQQIIPTAIAFATGMDAAVSGGDGSGAGKQGIPNGLKPMARELVMAVSALLGGGKEDFTAEGIKVMTAGHGGSLAKLNLGVDVGAPDSRLAAGLHVGLDGLDLPEVPKGVLRDYLPRHFSITPRISGIPVDDVVRLALHAIDAVDTEEDVVQAEAVGLLAKGPLEVGIEELSLDLGGATLRGIGALEIPSPDAVSGKAEITVTGLDELIKKATTVPELKQGAPVLMFLKGIGEQKGDTTVWRVLYENNSVMVNGTDMSQLIPGK